jgi:kinesin family member 1
MLGAGESNPAEFGLIPRVCFSLFEYFDTISHERGVKCSMEFSFLQIYNENLRDCLAPSSSTVLKGR